MLPFYWLKLGDRSKCYHHCQHGKQATPWNCPRFPLSQILGPIFRHLCGCVVQFLAVHKDNVFQYGHKSLQLMYDCGGRHLCYLYKHISSFLSPAMIIILQMILESFTDFLILVEWFVYKTTERCDFTTIIFYLCWANQHAWHTHNAFHIEWVFECIFFPTDMSFR